MWNEKGKPIVRICLCEILLIYSHASPRVNITEDGKQALLKLSKGDMRRALNVLQACHAAYDEVDETAVYNCTGNPHPKDVESVVQSMLRDEFGTSYECELAVEAKPTK